jgi:hypothetical protein
MAVERLTGSPALYRKAMMLAKRTGYGSVDSMLAAVAGEGHSARGRFIPPAAPAAGVPATDGDGTAVMTGRVYGAVHGGWRAID